MTTSIILGHRHGSQEIEIVAGPFSYHEGMDKFNELIVGEGEGFEEMYLHEIQFRSGRRRAVFPEKSRSTLAAAG
jgi:hypothetical protein